ncbi:MAG: hypothetical protein ACFE9I_18635 [Candidatus Hermodarchaeota archaeon]
MSMIDIVGIPPFSKESILTSILHRYKKTLKIYYDYFTRIYHRTQEYIPW